MEVPVEEYLTLQQALDVLYDVIAATYHWRFADWLFGLF